MENIILEKHYQGHRHIALLQLNRPKALNALNTETLLEVVEALESLEKDQESETRLAIITGNQRAFSAGADLKQLVQMSSIDQYSDQREKLWKRFCAISFPLIAAVNGFCLGAGHELAMSCDMVIAGDNALFGQPEIGVGIMPGAGGTQRFTRAIGKSRAMYYALTGEQIKAQEAYQWGLVAKLVPAPTLLLETFEVAKKIARQSPLAASLIKESINHAHESSLTAGLMFERRNFYLTFSGHDQKEGMQAFLEKRKPEYQGK